MRILYVSDCWTPLADVLYQGETSPKGMPAFFRVLERLVNDGHDVDMILYDYQCANQEKPKNIQLPWMWNVNILDEVYIAHSSSVQKIPSHFWGWRRIKQTVCRAMKQKQYDFVYGHGPMSEAAGSVCRKNGVPFGQRRYGDTYYSFICSKGKWYAFLSQPWNYISYRSRKAFMIATNDGSQVDKVYELLNPCEKPYPLYFWLNGTDRSFSETGELQRLPERPYLFYMARISRWKRQHLGVELLYHLKQRGIIVDLWLAGQKDDESYYQEIMNLAEQYGVKEQVVYVGTLDRHQIPYYIRCAFACLSFYEPCNLGNVLIEYMTHGGLVLSNNDGSLDGIVQNGESGFLVNDMVEAAQIIQEMQASPKKKEKIQKCAFETARKKFRSWEERIEEELLLIQRTVEANQK